MKSIFTDKAIQPTAVALKNALGTTFNSWQAIAEYTKERYPNAVEEWNFSSEKYGWSFRLKDKKRVLVYLLPRNMFFKVAFVFGQKATDTVLESSISEDIKNEIKAAKVYAEGRGIRIDINEQTAIEDIKKLIDIKIAN